MLLAILSLFANALNPPCKEEVHNQIVSEALGHMIGKHLEELGISIDLKALAKGLEEEAEGKPPPLNEETCLEAISSLREKKREEISQKNLLEAEKFLAKNKDEPGIQLLSEGKLQYQTLRKGQGQEVQSYNSPIIRLKGQYIDGRAFSEGSEEELVALDEMIPAFRLGLVGMKEGELRTLYVHPDLGYGREGHLSPNALLIFEVEVIRADAGADDAIHMQEVSIAR